MWKFSQTLRHPPQTLRQDLGTPRTAGIYTPLKTCARYPKHRYYVTGLQLPVTLHTASGKADLIVTLNACVVWKCRMPMTIRVFWISGACFQWSIDTGCVRCAQILSQSLRWASQTLREFPQNPPQKSKEKWRNLPQSMFKNSLDKPVVNC